MTEWLSPVKIAALRLPEIPSTQPGVGKLAAREGWATRTSPTGEPLARKRQGKGGGWEYHVSLLPEAAQIEMARRARRAAERAARAEDEQGEADAAVAWAAYEKLSKGHRTEAERRMRVMMRVEGMVDDGLTRKAALAIVLPEEGVARATYFDWRKLVRGKLRMDWLPALAPRWKAVTTGQTLAPCSPEAWEAFKADYLRLEKPSAKSCYDRVRAAGAPLGWAVPFYKTLLRRIIREVPAPLITYLREGDKALLRSYPAQQRSRAQFHALQGVCADGHTVDDWVEWLDGEVLRPVATVISDLYSNAILAWRVDKSESAAAVRLAFYDLFRDWGIPEFALLDNGRAFASKDITGGQKTRFRGKILPGENEGVLTALGVRVHWATPYSGQSKPIERSFRDLCDRVAKHPRLAGAYSGNTPLAKPDYPGGKNPAPFDVFMDVFAQGVAEHNARTGRRTEVARGRSFDEVFGESYAISPVRKASAEQLRLAMLASERITARAPSGSLHVLGNRYWSEWLSSHVGERLTVRFDPDDLAEAISVYDASGTYLGDADCWEAVGFHSVDAAREHSRKRRAYVRHIREAAKIERSMSIDELIALQPAASAPAPKPEAKVVRMMPTRGATALKPDEDAQPMAGGMTQAEVLRLLNVALDQRDEAV